jgi:CheY-like chemotaxis protein
MTDISPFRITISDDDEDDCHFLTTILKDLYGDTVQIRCPGDVQGCQRLLAQPPVPHLLMLDFHLPPLNALDLLGWMTSQPHLRALPTVVWSSRISQPEIDACRRAGVVACISKRSEFQVMKGVIRSLVDQWVGKTVS